MKKLVKLLQKTGKVITGGFILTYLPCIKCGKRTTDHFFLPLLNVYECVECGTRRPP